MPLELERSEAYRRKAAECPKKSTRNMNDPCGAKCPQLPQGVLVEFSSRRNHHLIAIGCGRSPHATIRVRSTVAAIQRHASNDAGFSSGGGRVSGATCQSANVTTPLTAANRRRKASLSPAFALSRRRLPISALVVRDFSSGLKDSHVSSNTVCKSWSVSGLKAFIVQTLTKPPSGWGHASFALRRLSSGGRRRLISHYSLV
jgi:hypothetical protein